MELTEITYTDLTSRPKLRKIMARYHHKESDQQIRFVKWFRITYPAFAQLMFHPHNEGNAFNRRQQALANKEGVTKGVADLIFLIPNSEYNFLTVELKNGNAGRQSKEQKFFERYVTAAGGKYFIGRSFDETVAEVTKYMDAVTPVTWGDIGAVYKTIDLERQEEAKRELEKMLYQKTIKL